MHRGGGDIYFYRISRDMFNTSAHYSQHLEIKTAHWRYPLPRAHNSTPQPDFTLWHPLVWKKSPTHIKTSSHQTGRYMRKASRYDIMETTYWQIQNIMILDCLYICHTVCNEKVVMDWRHFENDRRILTTNIFAVDFTVKRSAGRPQRDMETYSTENARKQRAPMGDNQENNEATEMKSLTTSSYVCLGRGHKRERKR